ncbi:MAG TPA: hypothetical protein VLM85_28590 [Polyangiaceae bacterium]|nr:hypothetical protein [Polyangiaceae bacterium]
MRALALVSFVAVTSLFGCPDPKDRPDVACADECKVQLANTCKPHDCERGCAFVLDRLVEHEQATVLDCMKPKQACDDTAWAECAARVGPHVDGGPGVRPASTAQEP